MAQLKREGRSLHQQYLASPKVVQKFREVTLDPETAHPNLLVSEDKMCVTFMRKKQRLLESKGIYGQSVVLGFKAFDCGWHYREVQVGDEPKWAVGVCEDCFTRKRKQSHWDRCWRIQLQNSHHVAQGYVPVALVLKEKPRGIGIYLDYELGQITFNSWNDRSHIHSFMDKFSDKAVLLYQM